MQDKVFEAFQKQYGETPEFVVRAPGRVNVIGEHTDYNDGYVLPLAIERAVWIALRPQDKPQVELHSLDFKESLSFSLTEELTKAEGWLEYAKGVTVTLQKAGYSLKGWKGVMSGNVPIGAGLSSSAALEMAVCQAFCAVSGLEWNAPQMAKLGQKAENEWVGVNCGIMDQMISAAGKKDHALLIDCRTLELKPVPLPHETKVVILDTTTRRGLVGSAYNERRSQCEAAAKHFGVKALRDISSSEFSSRSKELDTMTQQRARHVITENERTLEAAKAMCDQNSDLLGKLMNASHESLKDDFEVSNKELDIIVDCAHKEKSCFGARMTGAGFGGCAIALVKASGADTFVENVSKGYHSLTGLTPKIYVTDATNGASLIT